VCMDREDDHRIYDICVNTLKLCMMEHYVDCPWREQCLYVFDSRNQMLCGYYAFEQGNRMYARANHKLISMDTRADDLLSICYPCGDDLTIPSFALYWFMSVREYLDYTGDATLAEECYEKLIRIAEAFLDNQKDGLICRFSGRQNWNFYDWSEGLSGDLRNSESAEPDLMINCLFINALQELERICAAIGKDFAYATELEDIKARTAAYFYHPESGLFSFDGKSAFYHSLPNALALRVGLAKGEAAEKICRELAAGRLAEASLSMKIFIYDALLSADEELYGPVVLEEIRRIYGKMIDADSSTVWETELGAEDFAGAGSLCHGWSAISVWVYHRLKLARYKD